MQPEENKFLDTIYRDFEQKLYKVFGFGIEDLKKVINKPDTPEKKEVTWIEILKRHLKQVVRHNCGGK